MTKKLSVLLLKSNKTVAEIAKESDITVGRLYQIMKDDASAPLKLALKLEVTTKISHQFFLYSAPTCYQFVGDLL